MTRPTPKAWRRAELLFAATALFVGAFALLARAEMLFPLGARLDQRVELRVHGWMSGPILAVLRAASFFGSTPFILVAALGVAIYLWKIGAPRRLRAFAASIAGAVVWVQVFKQLFHRDRPGLFEPLAHAIGYSFPSGHSALSAAFFGSVAGLAAASAPRKRLAVRYLTAALAAVLAVGFSRVALGVHWPTDVLAGWAVGFGWLSLVFAIAERAASKTRSTGGPAPG